MESFPIFPTVNASLNFLAGCFLFLGFRAVKAGDPEKHRQWMLCAMAASVVFLISYLTYHHFHGSTKYMRQGLLRYIYFTILLTHTPLAAIVPPASITAVYFAFKGNFKKHVAITRWLYPIWIYVSITGVLIYLMLYIF